MRKLNSLLLLLCSLLFVSCENNLEKVRLFSRKYAPVETGKDIVIIYSDSGMVKGRLKSPLVERYKKEENYSLMPLGVSFEFFDSRLKVTSTMTAGFAKLYMRKDAGSVMEARKNVVVINEKGEQLNTEHLIWYQDKKMIVAPGYVKITRPDEVLEGNGLESNEDFTKYKILKLRGNIQIKNE